MPPIEIATDTRSGCIVGYHPAVGAQAVSIRAIANKLAAQGRIPRLTEEELTWLAIIDDPNADPVVGGRIGKKIKKGLKKAGKVIKKVAKNKIVKGIVSAVAKAVPPPYNVPIAAAQGAAKLGTAIAQGVKKAKQVKKVVNAAAKGKVTPAQLRATAKKLGVSPLIATQAAVIQKTANAAKAGDARAQAAMRLAADITARTPSAKLLAAAAGARTYTAKGPSGKTYSFRLA